MKSNKKHTKHPKISRPPKSNFHVNEIAIYGSNCNKIRSFYDEINHVLREKYSILFVDADHSEQGVETFKQSTKKQFYGSENEQWNHFDDKLEAISHDMVFINGNHYPANKQIVILDPTKKESLERRKSQLNNILCYISLNDHCEIYPFLADTTKTNIPVISVQNILEVCNLIQANIKQVVLKAIVLAGGKSQRMGVDKSQINYHGKPQELHIANLLKNKGLEVYVSKPINFEEPTIDGFTVIPDRFRDMGPYGAILTAFMYDVHAAWLVIACDLPLLNEEILTTLIENRKSSSFATAYRLQSQEFPEPLISIYEPKIYHRMLQFLSLGYACPRKVLINTPINELILKEEDSLKNVNTPQEKIEAQQKIDSFDE